ncbi:MAG: hypothetical protein ACD_3C00062G0005 [uncultured bacterium (gcode 4)]|uniref:Uncharacterized protein n=1 Tax=uncultured bacterium (gcode 4) TaxID=1234023 RepID=K2GY51_9BACT|nr:MAG: hypothetical protein ACD_3C00062G0005 [uncultured bacterium (gcode 4)]
MSDKIIETKKCTCWSELKITEMDFDFYMNISPIFKWVRYDIPSPTLCPECRLQRRLTWRNERNLYKRKCDATNKNVISIFSPDKPYKVYSQDEWWSDKWNPLDYGRDFDFSKTFFEQYNELLLSVPKLWILVSRNENSDYTNWSAYNKNCYLIFASDHNEDCYYSDNIYRSKDTFDSSDLTDSTLCYECMWGTKCSNCKYLYDCHDCHDLAFCFDCKNCHDCFLSSNLRNKNHYFKNKEYSKEEYFQKLEEYKYKTVWEILEELHEIEDASVHLCFHGNGNDDCLGDYISNCKNSSDVYSANNLENCKNIINWNWAKDCQDCYVVVDNSTLVYESLSSIWLNKWAFNFWCLDWSSNCYYSYLCLSASNLFWCDWLKNQSYCILNKQYTRDEYEMLVPKIIEHMKNNWEWWEFFPSAISPFWYNETLAMEYYPVERRDALQYISTDWKSLFKWSDYETPFPKAEKIIPASKLPGNIKDIPDDIINWAIECEMTWKPFRIIKQELDFYRKQNLPIPRKHPDERHLNRMKLRNPRKTYDSKCHKCGINIKTSYSPLRKEMIYCEECYDKEVI